MNIEYEATFANIDKEYIRQILKKAGAKLLRPEFLQKRITLNLPDGHEIKGAWLRIRDEGDKITMTLKIIDGIRIENQKEVCLQIDSLEKAVILLEKIGCKKKSYQETKREIWQIDGVEISIDEWPFLEPFVEIEGKTEEIVQDIAKKLDFNYQNALFCSVDTLYSKKYNIPKNIINKIPKITFSMENPFKNQGSGKDILIKNSSIA